MGLNTRLDGKRALVLGGATGLGFGVAQAFAESGAEVAIASRNAESLQEAARELAKTGSGIRHHSVDLASPDSVERFIAWMNKSFSGPEIVLLNGGGPPPAPAETVDPEFWRNQFEAMIVSGMRIVAAVLPHMKAKYWGRVLAVGSTSIREPIAGLSASNALRAGLAGWLKTLANEVAANGITVNMLLPGRLLTERTVSLDRMDAEDLDVSPEEVARRSQAEIPIGRYGTPEEFGAVAAFLASDAASYVTGAAIPVDGGLTKSMI